MEELVTSYTKIMWSINQNTIVPPQEKYKAIWYSLWLLTDVWPKPIGLLEVRSDGELEKRFPPTPDEGWLNKLDCVKGAPKAEPVCPIAGVVDWKREDDWVLPKFKLEGNVRFVPGDVVELKADCEARGWVLDELNRDELPNWEVVDDKKADVDAAVVDAKGFDEEEGANAEELNENVVEGPKVPKPEGLGANGLVDVAVEKGFGLDWLNVEEARGLGCALETPKPTPLADWPAGRGPPAEQTQESKIIQ